jgi:hypothetical protein
VAKDALNGTDRNVGLVEHGGPKMPQGVVAEIFHPGICASCGHDAVSILVRPNDPLLFFPAPIPVPEHPRDCLVAVFVTARKHLEQLGRHEDFPGGAVDDLPRLNVSSFSLVGDFGLFMDW